MKKTVYLVGHNMAGYLPDADPYYVAGKRAAVSESRENARTHRDDDDGEHRWRLSGRDGDYWLTSPDPHMLSYHYWITPMALQRVVITPDLDADSPYDRKRNHRCAGCEQSIAHGETAYTVVDNGDYLCSDCAGQ